MYASFKTRDWDNDEAWDKIRPAENWRNEIHTFIDPTDYNDSNDACIYWTGSPLDIVNSDIDGKMEVWSVGYRNGPCGP